MDTRPCSDQLQSDQLTFANYFMDRFVSAYAVNLETYAYRVYKRTERLEREYPVVADYREPLRLYAEREIHPDDRANFLEFTAPANLRKLLRTKLTVTHNFRVYTHRGERIFCLRAVRGGDVDNVAIAFEDVTVDVQKERNREQAIARANIFERMTDEDAVFLVNCERDERRTIYTNGKLAREFSDDEPQSRSFARYVETSVAPTDRAMMKRFADPARLLEVLQGRDERRVIYQELTPGVQRFCEMRIARHSDTEVVLGLKEKNREIVNRLILDRLQEDYNALFSVDMDTGAMLVLKDEAIQIFGPAGTVCSYQDSLMKLASYYQGEERTFFEQASDLNYIKQRFAKENKSTYVFRSNVQSGVWKSVTLMVLLRQDNGVPSLFVVAFNQLDRTAGEKAELQQHLRIALNDATEANRRNEAMHSIIKSASWSLLFNRKREIVSEKFSPDLFKVMRNSFHDRWEWNDLIHPDHRSHAMQLARAALDDPTGKTVFDTEYRFRSSSGEYHWIRGAGNIILNPDGSGEMYGICIDIDDSVKRRREEQRLLNEAHALERANEAKSRFFSMVSHDIRTPLNAIIGYAELLKLGIADNVERTKAIDSVLVSGQTLLELINDVLDLSKLEAGKMEIVPEPADARQLTESITDAFRSTVTQKSIVIRTDIPPMPWLRFDPHRVRQILFNLVGNAIKFTDKGEVKVSASYERQTGDSAPGDAARGTLCFEVSDTGRGMTEAEQRHIAQPFVQFGDSLSRNQGTGLGLTICKQLIHRMGGELRFESRLGKGTTFRVTLPNIEEETTPREQLTPIQRIRRAVSTSRTDKFRHVLVVDDQPLNRTVLKTMLARFGITNVTMAENGIDALNKMNAEPFDLVLTDMWMPEMDGEGLIREIRGNPIWTDLPVYAITADVEVQKNYEELGFTALLLKPVTLEKLKELLG